VPSFSRSGRFRRIGAAGVIGWLLLATWLAPPAAAYGQTPGTYVSYTFSEPTLTQVEFPMILDVSPGRGMSTGPTSFP
jgi:hypothetical protein